MYSATDVIWVLIAAILVFLCRRDSRFVRRGLRGRRIQEIFL